MHFWSHFELIRGLLAAITAESSERLVHRSVGVLAPSWRLASSAVLLVVLHAVLFVRWVSNMTVQKLVRYIAPKERSAVRFNVDGAASQRTCDGKCLVILWHRHRLTQLRRRCGIDSSAHVAGQ